MDQKKHSVHHLARKQLFGRHLAAPRALDSGELPPQKNHRENEGKTNFGDPRATASADPFNELV
jgi:hypothetical protein